MREILLLITLVLLLGCSIRVAKITTIIKEVKTTPNSVSTKQEQTHIELEEYKLLKR
uniref:Lipoprotein n=1 Tax=viral metagenome TaxID=1070528 RepID=A0A6M3JUI1_9ZZZZ